MLAGRTAAAPLDACKQDAGFLEASMRPGKDAGCVRTGLCKATAPHQGQRCLRGQHGDPTADRWRGDARLPAGQGQGLKARLGRSVRVHSDRGLCWFMQSLAEKRRHGPFSTGARENFSFQAGRILGSSEVCGKTIGSL